MIRMMKQVWRTYVFWILLAEAVGIFSAGLSLEGIQQFGDTVDQPPLSPPAIVFPIVWGILYGLMGISAARIRLAEPSEARNRSMNLYIAQLILNFFWSLIFFNLQSYGLAFAWLILLWFTVLLMILSFRKVDNVAAYLQTPYLLWLTFATYLNFDIWFINL